MTGQAVIYNNKSCRSDTTAYYFVTSMWSLLEWFVVQVIQRHCTWCFYSIDRDLKGQNDDSSSPDGVTSLLQPIALLQ